MRDGIARWGEIDHRKLKVGLYTPAILGGNSYLSCFYDWDAMKDPAHTGTSKGLSQAINRGPIRNYCQSMQMFM